MLSLSQYQRKGILHIAIIGGYCLIRCGGKGAGKGYTEEIYSEWQRQSYRSHNVAFVKEEAALIWFLEFGSYLRRPIPSIFDVCTPEVSI